MTDSAGREVIIPDSPDHVLCSGAGCLRLLVYLEAEDMIVAVDDMEKRETVFDARPYALSHPELKDYPLFGEFRGFDNPELIVTLEPQPDVIFKTFGTMGYDPDELQTKTGIPVVVLNYGDLINQKEDFYASLYLMAGIVRKKDRVEKVISYIENLIKDLDTRKKKSRSPERTCYIGGISYKGPHGFQSTEPLYPPFYFTHTSHVALKEKKELSELTHLDVSKEKIVEWDPDIVFIDLATLQSESEANALYELKTDPVFSSLKAVSTGDLYGVLPYNLYAQNYGSSLANAFFVGKILYPDAFADIDPREKADEIYTFLVGKPVFKTINTIFSGLIYTKLNLSRL